MSPTCHTNKTHAGCGWMRICLRARRSSSSDQKRWWETKWDACPYQASTLDLLWQRLEAKLETSRRAQREIQARHFQWLRSLIRAKRRTGSDEALIDNRHASGMIQEMAQDETHIAKPNEALKKTREIQRTLPIQGAQSTGQGQEAQILSQKSPLLSRSRLQTSERSSQTRVQSRIWYQRRCNRNSSEDSLACRRISRLSC